MSRKGGPIAADRLLSFFERIEKAQKRLADVNDELKVAYERLAAELGVDPGITYIVVGDVGRVKIGRTKNLEARISALQTAHGIQLRLLRQIPIDCEKALHKRYAHLRLKGEWFTFDPEMLTVTLEEILA